MGQLLFFDGISGGRQDVAVAGKYRAGNFAVVWGEERQVSIFKEQFCVAASNFDALRSLDFVGRGRVELQTVERRQKFMRFARGSLLGGERRSADYKKHREGDCSDPHAGSVFR